MVKAREIARIGVAMLVAVVGGVWWWDKPFRRPRDAYRLIKNAAGKRVSTEVYERRMAVCRQCPVFYAPLQTCGTPLRNHELGCFCVMTLKARIPDATCWLNDVDAAIAGWPKNL